MKVAFLTTDNREHYKRYGDAAPHFGSAPEALLEGFALLPEVEIHIVSCLQRAVPAPKKIADNIYYHAIQVPKIGWMRTLYSGCVRKLRRKLKEIAPDIVHGQGSECECAWGSALSGFPNVVTLHGMMREMARATQARPGSFYWLAGWLEALALRRTDGVVCISHFVQDRVRPGCRRTWLVPNAVRPVFFATPRPDQPPPACTLLNVGTVCTYKRQNELLDVIESLYREGLDFHAQFLGLVSQETDYGSRFLDRIRSNPRLAHLGLKPTAELLRTYDSASALVHVSAVETFGLVAAEALARNLKLFGFRTGGIVDIAENVDQAELLNEGDWEGLRRSLSQWIRSGFPRPTLACASVQARYEPLLVARRHLEIYREVLRSKVRTG